MTPSGPEPVIDNARQANIESQDEKASHGLEETRSIVASQARPEAHHPGVSHRKLDNPREKASQPHLETHEMRASHTCRDTQQKEASPSAPSPNDPSKGAAGAGAGDAFRRQLAYLAVGGYYDHQKLRTSHMNRVRDLVRKKNEGIPLDQVEEKKRLVKFDKKYKDETLSGLLKLMKDEGRVSTQEVDHIAKLLGIANAERVLEGQYKSIIEDWAGNYEVYHGFLRKTRGIGPILGGGLLAVFDVRKTKHISSFWAYAGLHVVDGKAPRRVKGEKLGYSTQARTLCWKVSDSFIKQRTPPYRGIYDRIKTEEVARLKDTAEKGWKLHADLRARRRMVKQFLADFWIAWRKSEGLPIDSPYSARFHPGEVG